MPPYQSNVYNAGGGYFDSRSNYGSPTSYRDAPIVSGPGGFLANNPEAAWGEFIAPFASGTDPFSNWVRSQFSQVYNTGYKPAMARNPSLTFHDQFLGGYLTPEMMRQRFMHQAPQTRGVNVGNSGGGRTRWSLQ